MSGSSMTLRGLLKVMSLATTVASLGGCGMFNPFAPSATVRYRTTIEIETPQGVKTGSSVTELERIEKGHFGDAQMTGGHIIGEAVSVDMPGGRTLFALLRSDKSGPDYPVQILASVFNYPESPSALRGSTTGTLVAQMKEAAKQKPAFSLRRADYPLLVTFADIADPKSVARVDPDNLATSFGPGVTLKRITVQITDDQVTTGIEKRLGWWSASRRTGGGLIPMERTKVNGTPRYKPAPGYDASLVSFGLSDFSTEAFK